MEVSGNPSSLLFLRFNQPSAYAREYLFRLLTLGDVQYFADEIQRLATVIPNQGSGAFGPDDTPILVQAAFLESLPASLDHGQKFGRAL